MRNFIESDMQKDYYKGTKNDGPNANNSLREKEIVLNYEKEFSQNGLGDSGYFCIIIILGMG